MPLYSEERLKRIKGVIPIGEFSRLMKENGYGMTRRSAGMVYLKTKIRHTPISGSTTCDTTDILPGYTPAIDDDLQCEFINPISALTPRATPSSTEQILNMFQEREAEQKKILKEQETRILKNA